MKRKAAKAFGLRDAALVVDEKCAVSMSLPKMGDADAVPDNVLLVSALAVKLHEDKAFAGKLVKDFLKRTK